MITDLKSSLFKVAIYGEPKKFEILHVVPEGQEERFFSQSGENQGGY